MRKEFIEDLENEIWIENNGYEIPLYYIIFLLT